MKGIFLSAAIVNICSFLWSFFFFIKPFYLFIFSLPVCSVGLQDPLLQQKDLSLFLYSLSPPDLYSLTVWLCLKLSSQRCDAIRCRHNHAGFVEWFFLIFFWCFTSPLLCLEPTKSDYHDELIKIHTMFSFVSPLGIGNFLLFFFSVFYWNKEKGPMHIHRMCNRWRVVLWEKNIKTPLTRKEISILQTLCNILAGLC